MLGLLLILLSFQIPKDNSRDVTHKSVREKIFFYKNNSICGYVYELKDGHWKVFINPNITSQVFDTKAEATKWAKVYCPK